MGEIPGYQGKALRVNLTDGKTSAETLSEAVLRAYVGGTGLGSKYLYDEVPAGVEWDDPENRMIWASGPLGGTRVSGTGIFSVVTKGPMTNLAGASQANGFLGAFLRSSGFDAIVFEGAAPRWSYLYVHDGTAELRDAAHLEGTDTWQLGEMLSDELGLRLGTRVSIFGIGPAGENKVRFAAIVGDQGHVASKNGVGAVMGAKRLKAVAVARGSEQIRVAEPARLSSLSSALFDHATTKYANGVVYRWGTGGLVDAIYATGQLPIRNLTTSIFEQHESISGQYMRTHFEMKPKTCWACRVSHLRTVKITEGPYAGVAGEEPEYECISGMGPNIGVEDAAAIVMLSNQVDRLGLDVNESSWTISWVMECFERGLLTRADTDGLEVTWGNVEAVSEILRKIALREGFGNLLAEGVMRASGRIGREAADLGVYTLKGTSPRGHDHRARWYELLDTCLSNTSTIEASFGYPPPLPGKPALADPFSPTNIATVNALMGGWWQFHDSLGVCRFCATDPLLTVAAVNAATAWSITLDDALKIGPRIVNQLRLFNLRHGLDTTLEAPSPRYSSTPTDGPEKGRDVTEHFNDMRRDYWKLMGWDEDTGRPLPETLRALGLEGSIC